MKTPRSPLLAALLCAVCCTPLHAADARPPTDPAQPVTTPRVGGSPADAAFRAAQQESGKRYSDARATCRTKPRAERGACMNAARADLKHARSEAKAAHDAAKAAR